MLKDNSPKDNSPIIVLRLDKCQSSQLHLDLCNLLGNSSDEDKLQVSKARDKNAEISKEKAVIIH